MDREKIQKLDIKIYSSFLIKGLKRIVYSYLKIKLTEMLLSLLIQTMLPSQTISYITNFHLDIIGGNRL